MLSLYCYFWTVFSWSHRDSNPEPLACKASALPNWAMTPLSASTYSCMKVPDLRISYTDRKYIRDDRMRFGSSRHPEYATSSYRALCSYHSSLSIASVIGRFVPREGLEPSTHGLRVRCATNCAIGACSVVIHIYKQQLFKILCFRYFKLQTILTESFLFLTVSNITNVSWTVKGFFNNFFRSWSAEVFPFLRGTPSGAWLIFNFNS